MPKRERAPDGTIHVFPDDATDEEIAAALDEGNREAGAAHGAPGSTYLGDVGKMLKGEVSGAASALNPINIVKGAYNLGEDILTNQGQRTIQGIQRIPQIQDPEQAGELIGNILGGVVAGKVIPQVPSAVRAVAKSTPVQVAGGVARGVAENIPGISPLVRGAYRGGADRLARIRDVSGGRLVPQGAQRTAQFADDVEAELLKSLDMPSEPIKAGGSVKPLTGKKGAVVLNPEAQGGMVSTAPDKFGMIATFPEDLRDLAIRGTQTRGPLRSDATAALVRELQQQAGGVKAAGRPILTDADLELLQQLRMAGR